MKQLTLILKAVCTLTCLGIAATLAFHSLVGWGWFLFAAILFAGL